MFDQTRILGNIHQDSRCNIRLSWKSKIEQLKTIPHKDQIDYVLTRHIRLVCQIFKNLNWKYLIRLGSWEIFINTDCVSSDWATEIQYHQDRQCVITSDLNVKVSQAFKLKMFDQIRLLLNVCQRCAIRVDCWNFKIWRLKNPHQAWLIKFNIIQINDDLLRHTGLSNLSSI